MNPRLRFISQTVLIALVLFGVLRWAGMYWPALYWLGYNPAVIAVILAAQGASWRRKALFVSLTVALSVPFLALVSYSALGRSAAVMTSVGGPGATDVEIVSFVAVEVLALGMPLAVLAFFVGRRASILWSAPRDRR